jgi:hypothetical protein
VHPWQRVWGWRGEGAASACCDASWLPVINASPRTQDSQPADVLSQTRTSSCAGSQPTASRRGVQTSCGKLWRTFSHKVRWTQSASVGTAGAALSACTWHVRPPHAHKPHLRSTTAHALPHHRRAHCLGVLCAVYTWRQVCTLSDTHNVKQACRSSSGFHPRTVVAATCTWIAARTSIVQFHAGS